MGNSPDIGWSDEQWSRANAAVQETAQKARVAAQFLPSEIHPDASAVALSDLTIGFSLMNQAEPRDRLVVNSAPMTYFTSLAVNVVLTSQEVADPNQAAALVQFRRAANMIARLEDALLFCGQPASGANPPGVAALAPVFDVGGGGNQPGLAAYPPLLPGPAPYFPRLDRQVPGAGPNAGRLLAQAIIDAVGDLEAAGHNGPFACVLDQALYSDLHDPTTAMILPADRVQPTLNGQIYRSSVLPTRSGVVLALGDGSIRIVVSRELHVKFLQITTQPRYVIRVSERLALQVSDWTAINNLHP